jgi:aspartate kinase
MRGQLNDIAFIVKKSCLDGAIGICRAFASEVDAQGVTFDSEVAKIALVGDRLAGQPEIPSQMFTVLAGGGINIDMIAAASTELACIVASSDVEAASAALSRAFLNS